MFENIGSAFASIWGNKVRSVLTVLGVVIGVSSVTLLVSVGQGLKDEVSGLVRGLGSNTIALTAGKVDPTKNQQGNPADLLSGDILTQADVTALKAIPEMKVVAPAALVPGQIKYGSNVASSMLLATTPDVLGPVAILKIDAGRMFFGELGKEMVLSANTATELFGDIQPVGRLVDLNGVPFTVVGVFAKSAGGTFSQETDSISMIPFGEAAAFSKGQTKIARMYLQANDDADVAVVKEQIKQTLLVTHNEVENFTVFTQDDILSFFDQFVNLATSMVTALASISLLVGGIGIMNIMLVTVTERTREIGLRKAVGATKGAILGQFLVEAIVVTLVGGLLGLALSYAATLAVERYSPLTPTFSLPIVGLAIGMSVVIGVLFGIWPAFRAASKDPIEALRYE